MACGITRLIADRASMGWDGTSTTSVAKSGSDVGWAFPCVSSHLERHSSGVFSPILSDPCGGDATHALLLTVAHQILTLWHGAWDIFDLLSLGDEMDLLFALLNPLNFDEMCIVTNLKYIITVCYDVIILYNFLPMHSFFFSLVYNGLTRFSV